MPTGGGKSLCYQLPALVLGRTAVVISPLIALMQDQAAQLAQMGIPAAVLNSSMAGGEQSEVMRKAVRATTGCCICRRSAWRAGYDRLATVHADCLFRHRRGALHFRMGTSSARSIAN